MLWERFFSEYMGKARIHQMRYEPILCKTTEKALDFSQAAALPKRNNGICLTQIKKNNFPYLILINTRKL